MLLVAGAYVAWYGWFELRVLAGATTSDPVISAAVGIQSIVSRWVVGLGAPGLLFIAAVAAALLYVTALARRNRSRRTSEPVG